MVNGAGVKVIVKFLFVFSHDLLDFATHIQVVVRHHVNPSG